MLVGIFACWIIIGIEEEQPLLKLTNTGAGRATEHYIIRR